MIRRRPVLLLRSAVTSGPSRRAHIALLVALGTLSLALLPAMVGRLSAMPAREGASSARPAQEEGPPELFVNTTVDMEVDPAHCEPGAICPMRSAISSVAKDGGVVRARFCGGGVEPPCLGIDDPNFDDLTGKWNLQTSLGFGFTISGTNMTVDFAQDVPGWSSPADNLIAIEALEGEVRVPIDWAIAIEGENGTLRGFDVQGIVQIGAVVLQVDSVNTQVRGVSVHSLFAVRAEDAASAFVLRGNRVKENTLQGNWCGITGDGSLRAPVDGVCLLLERGTSENVIGGSGPGERNVFCARDVGIRLKNNGTRMNVIESNDIGVTPSGEACGGGIGLEVTDEAHETRIEDNIIGGNAGDGIVVSGLVLDTLIQKNLIGFAGVRQPNGGYGINISGEVKLTLVTENVIAFNETGGIRVSGSSTLQNIITKNSIYGHAGKPLDINPKANGSVDTPRLSSVSDTRIIGTGCALCTIEIFSDSDDEARVYEGSIDLRTSGPFFFDKPEGFSHRAITVSATNPELGTSELSAPMYIDGAPPEPTATPITLPTATPRPPEAVGVVYLPWTRNGH